LRELNVDEMLNDLADRLREETDYRREAANIEELVTVGERVREELELDGYLRLR
jgi:predicted unusual protein kinase regulating ubiquinone biosynthesis (AarF/ABC1/UbiB family)